MVVKFIKFDFMVKLDKEIKTAMPYKVKLFIIIFIFINFVEIIVNFMVTSDNCRV
jgi:hypothetical protein